MARPVNVYFILFCLSLLILEWPKIGSPTDNRLITRWTLPLRGMTLELRRYVAITNVNILCMFMSPCYFSILFTCICTFQWEFAYLISRWLYKLPKRTCVEIEYFKILLIPMQKQRLCASVLNQTITWGFNALEYRVKDVATQGWTRIVLSINLGF